MNVLARIVSVGLFLGHACAFAGVPAPLPAEARTRLAGELAALLNDPVRPVANLSVLAMRAGEVVYEGHFGYRSIDPADPARNLPVDQNTRYRVASMSKMVVAIGFMRLVEAGRIDLDADASLYLGFPLRNPAFPDRVITARMLLSHTASLRDGADEVYTYPQKVSLASVLTPSGANYDASHWAKADPAVNQAPGAFFIYTNLNWGVLASIIEKVSGQRFDRYMKASVLAPLGIQGGFNSAEFTHAEALDLATLYRKKDDKGKWDPSGAWYPQGPDRTGVTGTPIEGLGDYVIGTNGTLFSPQGGLRISVHDLGRIMQLLQNGGALGPVRLLKASTVQEMCSERWRFDEKLKNGDTYNGQMLSWGLGIQRFTDTSAPGKGDRMVAQGGFTGCGHLAEAYGLVGGFVFNAKTRDGMIYLIGGMGANPDTVPGTYSTFYAWEEKILTSLFTHAILQQ